MIKDKPANLQYPHLASLLYNTPLMIHPDKAAVIEEVFRNYVRGQGAGTEPAGSQPARDTDQAFGIDALQVREGFTPDKPYVLTEGGTAVIPIIGVLQHRLDLFDALSGMISYPRLARRIRHATENSAVKGILLEVDSPGGATSGLFELADQILATRETKPIWSMANEYMFSAAYAIGSATQRITSPRTGMVGSIGVIAMHIDQSGMNEKRGLKYTPIFAGRHKNDFSPHSPLSDEARARAQFFVDEVYQMFVAHVALARDMDEENVRNTEAQVFTIQEAIDLGLADAIATLDETVDELESTYGRSGSMIFQSRATRTTQEETSAMKNTDSQITPLSAGAKPADIRAAILSVLGENQLNPAVLKSEFPELAQQLNQEGADAAREEATAAGASAERERIQAVYDHKMPGHEALIEQLMFDGKTSGDAAAAAILKAEKEKRHKTQAGLDADAAALKDVTQEEPGDSEAGSGSAAGKQRFSEEACKADWEKNKGNCQAEFSTYETYRAYCKANAGGKVRILGEKKPAA